MPYIKIEVTREGVTREQKQQLIKGVTDLITNVLNKDPHLTHVVIQEVDLDNWGYAGNQVSVLREMELLPIKINDEKANDIINRFFTLHTTGNKSTTNS
jgi:4-oxalocrotonate tautomerase